MKPKSLQIRELSLTHSDTLHEGGNAFLQELVLHLLSGEPVRQQRFLHIVCITAHVQGSLPSLQGKQSGNGNT